MNRFFTIDINRTSVVSLWVLHSLVRKPRTVVISQYVDSDGNVCDDPDADIHYAVVLADWGGQPVEDAKDAAFDIIEEWLPYNFAADHVPEGWMRERVPVLHSLEDLKRLDPRDDDYDGGDPNEIFFTDEDIAELYGENGNVVPGRAAAKACLPRTVGVFPEGFDPRTDEPTWRKRTNPQLRAEIYSGFDFAEQGEQRESTFQMYLDGVLENGDALPTTVEMKSRDGDHDYKVRLVDQGFAGTTFRSFAPRGAANAEWRMLFGPEEGRAAARRELRDIMESAAEVSLQRTLRGILSARDERHATGKQSLVVWVDLDDLEQQVREQQLSVNRLALAKDQAEERFHKARERFADAVASWDALKQAGKPRGKAGAVAFDIRKPAMDEARAEWDGIRARYNDAKAVLRDKKASLRQTRKEALALMDRNWDAMEREQRLMAATSRISAHIPDPEANVWLA